MSEHPTERSTAGWEPPSEAIRTKRPIWKRTWFIVTAALVVMLLLFSGCVAVVSGALNEASKELSPADTPKETAGTPATTTPTTGASATDVPTDRYDAPRVAHFRLTVKTLSKECFGSAGCNVSFRVEAGWEETYNPDKEYELTYKILGGEDAKIETMRIRGDEYERVTEDFISTRTSSSKLRAVPVSVEEV